MSDNIIMRGMTFFMEEQDDETPFDFSDPDDAAAGPAGGSSAAGVSAGGVSAGGVSAGGVSAGGVSAGGASAGGSSAGGSSAGGSSAGGSSAAAAGPAGGSSAAGDVPLNRFGKPQCNSKKKGCPDKTCGPCWNTYSCLQCRNCKRSRRCLTRPCPTYEAMLEAERRERRKFHIPANICPQCGVFYKFASSIYRHVAEGKCVGFSQRGINLALVCPWPKCKRLFNNVAELMEHQSDPVDHPDKHKTPYYLKICYSCTQPVCNKIYYSHLNVCRERVKKIQRAASGAAAL